MNQIKDTITKITYLKISITEAAIIHTLYNFNSHFQSYLTILSHNAQEKEKLISSSKLTNV